MGAATLGWYPGRGAISVQLGSLLGVLGAVLILRSLATAKPGAGWGVALVLIKVQFGVRAAAIGLARRAVAGRGIGSGGGRVHHRRRRSRRVRAVGPA
ncbi:hypothetical protein [Amycolatopsis sp. NPDC006125]|uniref:hypothetical protein n=1 Tax=Amycolatopsis sp. NPDC006125 TaxID=3156730 RepID=UPI0033A9867A